MVPGTAPFQVRFVTILDVHADGKPVPYFHPVLPVIQGTPPVVLVLMYSHEVLLQAFHALQELHNQLVSTTRQMAHQVARLGGYR